MIFVEWSEPVVIEHNGQRQEYSRVPYNIRVAAQNGELVVFDNLKDGLLWWNAGLEDKRKLKHEATIDVSQYCDFLNMKYERGERTLASLWADLPVVPTALKTYMMLSNYSDSVIGGNPAALDELRAADDRYAKESIYWMARPERMPWTVNGICLDLVTGQGPEVVHTSQQVDVEVWRAANPKIVKFWHTVEIAAKVSLDSLDAVSVDIADGKKLIFRGEQIIPGVGALTIELPSSCKIYFKGAKLEGSELIWRGRPLTHRLLTKYIAKRLAWEYRMETLYRHYVGSYWSNWLCSWETLWRED